MVTCQPQDVTTLLFQAIKPCKIGAGPTGDFWKKDIYLVVSPPFHPFAGWLPLKVCLQVTKRVLSAGRNCWVYGATRFLTRPLKTFPEKTYCSPATWFLWDLFKRKPPYVITEKGNAFKAKSSPRPSSLKSCPVNYEPWIYNNSGGRCWAGVAPRILISRLSPPFSSTLLPPLCKAEAWQVTGRSCLGG